jgi:DMSO/TMAO reductase YedYZ molybdopterin-dependent catalytic subunit
VPVEKALEDESLIAWAMNGEDIPAMNGYPLRLVIAGWPGSVAGKWLKKIVVRNQVHDGAKRIAYPANPSRRARPYPTTKCASSSRCP